MIDFEKLFQQLQERFNSQAAAFINGVFQFNLSDEQSFSCEVKEGVCSFQQGAHDAADIELSLASDLLLDIVAGKENALQAFMEGSIVAQGDLSLAPALASLFGPVQNG